MSVVRGDGGLLVFERTSNGQRLRCVFNLSAQASDHRPEGKAIISTDDLDGGVLGPYSAVIEEIA